jgi:hypothetical protein
MNLSTSVVSTLAGQPQIPGAVDGAKYSPSGVYADKPALFNNPVGLCVLSGRIYVADTGNSIIRVIQ